MNRSTPDVEPGPILSPRVVADRFSEALARGALTRDENTAKLFAEVAQRFRDHHHAAEVVGIQARDYQRPFVSGGGHGNSPAGGSAARDRLRAVCEAVEGRLLPYLHGSLIENRSLVELGQSIAGIKSRKHAVERAKQHLVEGLNALVAVWRLAPNPCSSGISSSHGGEDRIHEGRRS